MLLLLFKSRGSSWRFRMKQVDARASISLYHGRAACAVGFAEPLWLAAGLLKMRHQLRGPCGSLENYSILRPHG